LSGFGFGFSSDIGANPDAAMGTCNQPFHPTPVFKVAQAKKFIF
jgi:hypothetical protein